MPFRTYHSYSTRTRQRQRSTNIFLARPTPVVPTVPYATRRKEGFLLPPWVMNELVLNVGDRIPTITISSAFFLKISRPFPEVTESVKGVI
ncbi:hypothetical protein PVAG01_04608 [Phlyctema vagabunda]|uniref:Uncharacterized protein n=1 Tax=Phlyctema vagabunda TaxID=108571 RepID=A0ABR4PHQ6_9HELO